MASIVLRGAPAREITILGSNSRGRSVDLSKVFPKSLSTVGNGMKNRGRRVEAVGGGGRYKGTQMREKKLTEMIEKKVKEAEEVCGEDMRSDECKVAWDEVEEVSQAKADFKLKLEVRDPLEYFCQDNPETDECVVYEDEMR